MCTTTSATIYNITTTGVDDIKCTNDQSTIEEDVENYDQSAKKQVYTTTGEFDTTIVDVKLHTMSTTADKSCTTIIDVKLHTIIIIHDKFNTTIYNITTTVVDDIKCTTNQGTIEEVVAVV